MNRSHMLSDYTFLLCSRLYFRVYYIGSLVARALLDIKLFILSRQTLLSV